MQKRIDWVDQVKGFAIFLVVYGHNFPVTEKYIYTFHMPLFFMVSGFFFPSKLDFSTVKKRFKSIMIPYFFWASFLFIFWFLIGRKYGASSENPASVWKNFIGIFYAQGDSRFMEWGIPMWFLPAIFLCFSFYFLLKKYLMNRKSIIFSVLFLTSIGFLYSRFFNFKLPWSIDVAFVALFFFAFGNFGFKYLQQIPKKWALLLIPIFLLVQLLLYNYNIKIDMYRSIYGNEFLFLLNGLLGSLCVIFLFQSFPYFKLFSVIGKFTLLILALQLLAMTVIKLFLWKALGRESFHFSELERFFYAFIQIALIYPVFLIVNRYFPVLNGGYKKV
jgi:fucose 4-O-acetylase-like acetyltransferase